MAKDIITLCNTCSHRKVCMYKSTVVVFSERLFKEIPEIPSILELEFHCQAWERERTQIERGQKND